MPLPKDSKARKEYPVATGVIDYFPDALIEVAHISYCGNQKHNPGQPLHHARGKSNDHADCEIRHMIERGTFDTIEWVDEQGVRQVRQVRHSAAKAWRALAELQQELEDAGVATLARGARLPEPPVPLIPDGPVDSVIAEITGGVRSPGNAAPSPELDPVSKNGDGKWYFWDDGWMLQSGPYDSEMEARAAYGEYRRVTDAQ